VEEVVIAARDVDQRRADPPLLIVLAPFYPILALQFLLEVQGIVVVSDFQQRHRKDMLRLGLGDVVICRQGLCDVARVLGQEAMEGQELLLSVPKVSQPVLGGRGLHLSHNDSEAGR